MSSSDKQIYRFADVEVNISQNCLKRGDEEQHLRRQAFSVLVHLLEQRQRLVTKEELMEVVWKDTAVTDDALVQCIKEIRRVTGDDSHHPRFIKTISKSGYRFIGALEETQTDFRAADLSEKKTDFQPTFSIRELFAGRKVFFVLLLSIFAISLLVFLGQTLRQTGRNSADVTLPPIAGKKSLAVMYFENQTGNAELEWLREGLAAMLITNLSRSNKINVLSRQQFHLLLEKNGIQPSNEIPFEQIIAIVRKSQAENFITGSFAKAGEKIRIDVQLHDSKTSALLASESLIVEKPEQILTEIDLLSMKLAKYFNADESENQTNFADVMTDNLEAFRYYSLAVEKAQALHNREALALLEKAVALDPQFAMAHARIGYTYAVTWGIADKSKPHLEKAFKLAERLSEKDRLNTNAWYAIANLDYQNAIEIYREIISKYPLETESYWRLGRLLEGEERLNEAVAVLKQGLIIDAEAKNIYNLLGSIYSESGKHTEAIAAHQRYIAFAPNEANAYDSLGLSYQWSGDYPKAIENYNRALELKPHFEVALVHLANARFQTGQYNEAINLYRRYIEVAPSENERARGWDAIAHVYLKKQDLVSAKNAVNAVIKNNPSWVWSAFVVAVEKGDTARVKKLEELVFAKPTNNNRGARNTQRFELYSRGYIALKKGQTDEAIANFQATIERKPPIWNIEPFEDCLANALLKLDRVDEAIAEYRRILQLNPNYPLVHFYLAQVYLRQGQLEKARDFYQQFLQVWKDADADIPEIIIAKQYISEF